MDEQVNVKIEDLKSIKTLNIVFLILTLATAVSAIFLFIPFIGAIAFSGVAIASLVLGILILVKISEYKDLIKNYTLYMVLFILGFFILITAVIGSIMLMLDKDIQNCLDNSQKQ